MSDSTANKPKKTTFYIDPELLADAREVTGASTDSEVVRLGLQELVRKAAVQRMRSLLGASKGEPVRDVPRRREPAAARTRSRKLKKSA
ncbi:MAG TPA: type II toxin-antitoxin system VapB family antitoxin [Polyangiales bacterium]